MTREEAIKMPGYNKMEVILDEDKLKRDGINPKSIFDICDREMTWKDKMIKSYNTELVSIYACKESGSLGVAALNALEEINKAKEISYVKRFEDYDK